MPAVAPPDHRVEGHVPADPDDDHCDENSAGDQQVPDEGRRLEARQNRADLQADENEREHVQQEDGGLPHGVGGDTYARGNRSGAVRATVIA